MHPAQCPKCGHVRAADESPEQCGVCGVYFAKWAQRNSFVPTGQKLREAGLEPRWRSAIRERLNHVPSPVDPTQLYGRALLLSLLSIWGLRLSMHGYRDGAIWSSFMHAILLPIHEAGHVLLMPFGEFITILGGSLFQLLIPLIVAGTLWWQNRDPFGAGLGVWWCGVSLMDLAPYIYDASQPVLPMLGGHTGETGPHDWVYLLGTFSWIPQAHTFGGIAHGLGVVVMLAGAVWAGRVLWHMRKTISTQQS